MQSEIIEQPLRFHLHGLADTVPGEQYAAVGLRLMDDLWRTVKAADLPTTGINHWVYLPQGRMFVGVQLRAPLPVAIPAGLAPLEFELPRYLRHLHLGPYQALPQKWKRLLTELAARGEVVGSPSLEIYGHPCDEPSQLETTILIGLQAKAS